MIVGIGVGELLEDPIIGRETLLTAIVVGTARDQGDNMRENGAVEEGGGVLTVSYHRDNWPQRRRHGNWPTKQTVH